MKLMKLSFELKRMHDGTHPDIFAALEIYAQELHWVWWSCKELRVYSKKTGTHFWSLASGARATFTATLPEIAWGILG